MKRALGFGFWVTHGGRESLARISSCCLAFIFRLLCPISNCFGGLRFHFFYCARYPFYFVSLSLSRSLLRFQLVQIWYPCYAKLLYNYSGFTTSTSSVCHFSTSLIRIETNRRESNRRIFICSTKRHSTPSLSLSCANIVALSIIYDLYFPPSAPHGPVAKF